MWSLISFCKFIFFYDSIIYPLVQRSVRITNPVNYNLAVSEFEYTVVMFSKSCCYVLLYVCWLVLHIILLLVASYYLELNEIFRIQVDINSYRFDVWIWHILQYMQYLYLYWYQQHRLGLRQGHILRFWFPSSSENSNAILVIGCLELHHLNLTFLWLNCRDQVS